MNTFLQSNKSSALLSVVGGAATQDLFDYKTSATPNPATERVVVKPNGGIKGFGQVVTFDIPSYGILDRVFVRFTIKDQIAAKEGAAQKVNGLTTSSNQILGIQLVDYIEIASQNKVICRVTRGEFIASLDQMTTAEQTNMQELLFSVSDVSTTVPAGQEVFVPYLGKISGVKSAFAEKFDTSFTERLQLRIKFSDKDAIGADALEMGDCDMINYFMVLPESDMKRLHEVNYSSGPLVLLNATSFDENIKKFGSEDTAQSATVDIACNGVITRTTIRVKPSAAGASHHKCSKLTKITLNGSGRELISFFAQELEHGQKSNIGYGGNVCDNVYIIDHTLSQTLPGFAGGVSLREVAAPSLTLETDAADGFKESEIIVTHTQLELISILGSNGRIQQNIST